MANPPPPGDTASDPTAALAAALAATHDDPVTAATAASLRKAVRKSQDPTAAAEALRSAAEIDLSGDPFFKRGPGLDCDFLAAHAAAFPALRSLALSRNDLRSPAALADLGALSSLAIIDCKVTDVFFLARLRSLRCLRAGENPVADPAGALASFPLEGLTALALPAFGGEGAGRLRDLGPLERATALEELDVSHNTLSSLGPLRALAGLRILRAGANLVDDLAPLSRLRNLRVLELQENRLTDLTPLEDLFSLADLDVRSNGVRSLKPLRGLRDLQRARLGGNPLYDDDYDAVPRSVRMD